MPAPDPAAHHGRRRALLAPPAALLAAALAACGAGAPPPELPRVASYETMDLLIADAIQAALAAAERGEAGALLELGLVYEANQMFGLAVDAYDLALARPGDVPGTPPAALWFHRGRALVGMGAAEEAARSFARSAELDPTYVPAWWRQGNALVEAGRVHEALAAFERGVAVDPENVAARLGLARTQVLLDDPRGALATLAPVVARRPDERFVHGVLARAWQALGDDERSRAELRLEEEAEHVSMADPLTDELRQRETGVLHAVQRANRALAAGSPRDALLLMRPVYEREPENLAALQMFARALVEDGQAERAIPVLERALELHPEDYKLELLLGLALQRQSRTGAALDHMRRAHELNPHYTQTLVALGELLAAMGLPGEAEERLREAVASQEPEVDLAVLLALGQVQQQLAAWERAAETYARASAVAPDAAAPWALLAVARHHAGDAGGAEQALREAERIAPQAQRVRRARALLDGEPE